MEKTSRRMFAAAVQVVSAPGADAARRLHEIEDEPNMAACRVVPLLYRDLVLYRDTVLTEG